MKPKRNDPIDRIRRAVEFVAPVTHRPVTTGLHEAMVKIFVAGPAGRAAGPTPRRTTRRPVVP